VIKIRYADLPAGLHISAVARGKDTIIYLLPGLTAAQRQAAMRRARSSARMGQGPRLPVTSVLGAVMVDRMRTTLRNAGAAMRGHPAILVPPLVIIASAAAAYILLVSVNLGTHGPHSGGSQGTPVPAGVAPLGNRPDDPRALPGPASPGGSGPSRRAAHKRSRLGRGAPSPSPARSASTSPSPSSSPSVTPSAGGANSAGSGSGSPGAGGVCADLGACRSP
jgi:hypothetical protein